MATGKGPILDAGASAGLLDERLVLAGYGDLEALDMSEGMVTLAERGKVYRGFRWADLAASVGIPDSRLAGAFGITHAPACGIRELARLTRPGGHPILTIRMEGIDGNTFPDEEKCLYVVWVFRGPETSGPRHG